MPLQKPGMRMDLIDRCYEAALVPDEWDGVLGALCARAGAAQASMVFFDRDAPPIVAGHNLPASSTPEFRRVWRDSPAVHWGLTEAPSAFTTFRENLPAETLAADRAVTMLDEQGLTDHAVSVQALGDGRSLAFMFARETAQGRYAARDLAALDAMRPHIVRAGLIATRLGVERARSMVGTLERLGLAAAVLAGSAKVIAANALLEAMPAVLVPTAFGGIALADRLKDARFRDALRRTGAGAEGPALSMPLPGGDAHAPLILHLTPVRGQARDVFADGHVLLVAAPVNPGAAPDPALLHGLFDLTAAEAELTRELATGATLSMIAARTGRSINTLRAHLRAVMAKTGTHRQAELMRLLRSF